MISEETLKKLLDNMAKIHELAQEENLKNPRLRLPQDGEYHTLHFMMEFSPGKRKLARDNDTLDEILSKLLCCSVKVWKQFHYWHLYLFLYTHAF